MSCDRWRQALSAISDGESPDIDERLVAVHVARCEGCQRFRNRLSLVTTASETRLDGESNLEMVGSRNERLARAVAAADRASRPLWMRAGLALLSCQIFALSVRPLLTGGDSGSPSHDVRHAGAFSVAYAVGLMLVVARPSRARALMPVAVTLVAALVLSALADIVGGRVSPGTEIRHLPELLSLPLLMLVVSHRPDRSSRDSSS